MASSAFDIRVMPVETCTSITGSHYRTSSISFQLSQFAFEQELINMTEFLPPSDALEQPDKLTESWAPTKVSNNDGFLRTEASECSAL